MQQVQQRELPERISWARAIVFATGFFFLSAILLGQLPSYIYSEMTAATLEGFEHGMLSLSVVCLSVFAVINVIVLLFDPKPVIPPRLLIGGGVVLAVLGLGLTLWSTTTGCAPAGSVYAVECNQYFPKADTNIWSIWGGKFLWFQPHAIDFVMLGLSIMGVGLATIFYSVLALGEMKNPDRRDLGVTPAMRWMIAGSAVLLIVFVVFYTYVDLAAAGAALMPGRPFVGFKLLQLLVSVIMGAAILLALAAFALRLHYLMRPIRQRTMPNLYMVGAFGLAQIGAIFFLAWLLAYPFIMLVHNWEFIGLGKFLTNCSDATAIPQSCAFGSELGYLVDAIFTGTLFVAFLAAIWAWKSHRNLVVIASVVTTAVIGLTALLVHTSMSQLAVAMMATVAILVLAAIWTSVSRREFALVGENNLGCLGQWLVFGTCLAIYIASFAFFSMVLFGGEETPPNIPFASGGPTDAFVTLVLLGLLAALQFFFLVRNRYKV